MTVLVMVVRTLVDEPRQGLMVSLVPSCDGEALCGLLQGQAMLAGHAG